MSGQGFTLRCTKEDNCFRKKAGILSCEEIISHGIIEESVKGNYNPTTYDLRLGAFHYVYNGDINNSSDKKWKPVYIGDVDILKINTPLPQEEQFSLNQEHDYDLLVIPSLGSALVELKEIINTNKVAQDGILIVGRFDLKHKLTNSGLISQQGTQIEPFYKGRLYCFIHNLSGEDVKFKYNDAIASVEFSYVSCFCGKNGSVELCNELRKRNKRERFSDESTCFVNEGIKNIRYFKRKRTLPSNCGLATYKAELPENIVSVFFRALAFGKYWYFFWVVFLGSIAGICGFLFDHSVEIGKLNKTESNYTESDRKNSAEIHKLRNELDDLKGNLAALRKHSNELDEKTKKYDQNVSDLENKLNVLSSDPRQSIPRIPENSD